MATRKNTNSDISDDEIREITPASEVEVINDFAYDEEGLNQEELPYYNYTVAQPKFLKGVLDSLRNEQGKFVCTIYPIQLAKSTVAEIFVSWLHNLMSTVNTRVEEQTNISILASKDVQKDIVGSFANLYESMNIIFGHKTHNTGTLDDLRDLAMTCHIKEYVKKIFTRLYENFNIGYENIVLQVPKSIIRTRQNYRHIISSDGLNAEWTPTIISYGFMKTYLPFIKMQEYTKSPKI